MGLDTTHGCWHGSYSSFGRWREAIARAAGLPPLGLMEGYFQRGDVSDPIAAFAEKWPAQADEIYRSLPIQWESLRPNALYLLLHHSDCDGELQAADCAPIADALETVLPFLKEDAPYPPGYPTWRMKTEQFIAGLRQAASLGENVNFH